MNQSKHLKQSHMARSLNYWQYACLISKLSNKHLDLHYFKVNNEQLLNDKDVFSHAIALQHVHPLHKTNVNHPAHHAAKIRERQ